MVFTEVWCQIMTSQGFRRKRILYLALLRHRLLYSYVARRFVNNKSWWRHQIETFSALLAICAGNSPVPGEFPAQRPVTRNFDVFFDLRLNKQLSKQWWGWWFETLSHPLWRHRNVMMFDHRCNNDKSGNGTFQIHARLPGHSECEVG